MKRILITTGDADGIGLEVAAKSLYKLGPKIGVQFILFKSHYKTKKWDQLIAKKFKKSLNLRLSEHNPTQLQDLINEHSKLDLITVESDQSPAKWFEDSVRY
jgi:4-hydroxy-L-threonine phosphate dehydrogenase PdxA